MPEDCLAGLKSPRGHDGLPWCPGDAGADGRGGERGDSKSRRWKRQRNGWHGLAGFKMGGGVADSGHGRRITGDSPSRAWAGRQSSGDDGGVSCTTHQTHQRRMRVEASQGSDVGQYGPLVANDLLPPVSTQPSASLTRNAPASHCRRRLARPHAAWLSGDAFLLTICFRLLITGKR